ncbi:MAG TPA: hypothetical protein VHQ24_01930 [Lachnospiraceae bacterium]|nr:hypothetical protein [Lachnospiraceae bacterium]HEX3075608.1 hypothetical protein [Lachnospiraceae bacterium]
MNYRKEKYSEQDLKNALDLVEKGHSHAEVLEVSQLNKSIVAREMRKRKNDKADQARKEYSKKYTDDNIRIYEEMERKRLEMEKGTL